MSNEKGLSAECIACDRAGSHGKHGSASMLMAWRSAPPNACRKCELGEQLEVERRTFSKICDRSRERNRLPLATTVADLRCHSQCAVQLFPEGSRSTRTHPVARSFSVHHFFPILSLAEMEGAYKGNVLPTWA